jgi:hypothetical protein
MSERPDALRRAERDIGRHHERRADLIQQLDDAARAAERTLAEHRRAGALRRLEVAEQRFEDITAEHDARIAAMHADRRRDRESERERDRLARLRPDARKRLAVLELRCPESGCLLARCYRLRQGLFYDPAGKWWRGTFVDWTEANPRRLTATCRHGILTADERVMLDTVGWANGRTVVAGAAPGVSWTARR